ncbi:MAG: O-antigen ligase family protein [Terracidiphilus sp.]|jgi:O-antigen ligase
MAMIGYGDSMAWQASRSLPDEQPRETSVWEEASAWVALLPTLYITARGVIQYDTGPAVFQFTAMEEDPVAHRVARLVFSLIVLLLLSSRFRSILDAAKRSKLLLLLPAIAFLSMLWSEYPGATLVGALNLLVTTLFAFYLYVRYPGDRLISFLTFAAFVSLALCVLSVTAFPAIGTDPRYDDAWRGIFGHKNVCAVSCLLFLTVGLHARPRRIAEQFIRGSVIFLSLVFILMSGSRQGWLLAALAIALTYSLRFVAQIRSLERLLFYLVLSIPLCLAVFFVQSNFTQLMAALGKDPTMSQRTIIWEQVLLSIAKRPLLGYGYSAFWSGLHGESIQAVLVTGWSENQAQSGYLDLLLQLGLAGLISLIVVLLRALAQAFAAIEHKMPKAAVLWAIVLLPLVLAENVGESWLLVPMGIPWLYALMAFLILNRPDRCAEES